MRSIIISTEDIASRNIRDRLLEAEDWEEIGEFRSFPAYGRKNHVMVQHEKPHRYAEGIDAEVERFLGERPELMIFASKHKSESGKRALTVHAVGNYGKAEYGGKESTLSVSCPILMTEALRLVNRYNQLGDFSVSYEVTHHGPYLEIPSFFIEIGSTEEEWKNRMAGEAIAKAILELGEIRESKDRVAIGIGGGHYAPRFSELALEKAISFGHMAPKYAVENLDRKMLKQMVEKSGAEYVYFHKVGLKRSQITEMRNILEDMGVRRIKSDEMQGNR